MNNEYLQDLKRNLCECRFNRSDFMHQQWLNAINDLQQENKELHNKIDKLEDELEWYKQECDDLEMSGGVDE